MNIFKQAIEPADVHEGTLDPLEVFWLAAAIHVARGCLLVGEHALQKAIAGVSFFWTY